MTAPKDAQPESNTMKTMPPTPKPAWPLLLLLWLSLALAASAQTTNVWVDNFESPTVWNNWSVDNGVWEIGNPTLGPVTNSAGYRTHEGTNCAATVLAGNYPAGTSSRLIRTTPFVVPAANQNPRLQFWHWYQFSGNSYGVVQIKYGTNNWTDISPRYYNTGSGVWTRPVVDLSPYGGKAVQIAFQIAADGNAADGWDVDEVSVIKGPYSVGFTNGLTESFELGIGDWFAETGTWEVGKPTSGPGAAHNGSNCLATVLSGNYADDRSSRFISPPLVVPTADQNPRLRFCGWYSIAANDFCELQIKVGTNTTWQTMHQYSSSGSGVWSWNGFDLSAYAGQPVQIGFYFESHGHSSGWPNYNWILDPGLGWYVDEVALVTGPIQALQPNVAESFESGWKDWYAENGTWEIGRPTSGPGAAHAGANCAATVLGGNYTDDTSGRLVSPRFAVPSADQNPRLRFSSWFNIAGNDFCELQIKVGTNTWQTLHQYRASGSGVWSWNAFDLSGYAGQTVQLGFYFESHGYSSGWPNYNWLLDPGLGWYVDEVALATGPIQALQPNVAESFESGWKDWYVEDGTWEIGRPTSGPGAAHAGANCAATVLGGNYTDDTSGRLVSPPFEVGTVGSHPSLRFWHWFSIAGHDLCEVQLKVVGGGWETLAHYGPASSGAWTRTSFDLSQYAEQTVQLGFYFESHGYSSGWPNYNWLLDPGLGWYVDEVMVTSVTPPVGIVQFTDARYFINEGETNATITVERKFGSAGAVDVAYIATDGTASGGDDFDSVVDVLSWADGEQGVKTFTVPIHQDALEEGNETVLLQLAVPGELASTVAREEATLVIIDDDGPQPLTTNIAYLRSLVGTTNWVPTNTTSLFTVEGTVTTYTNLNSTPDYEVFFMQDDTAGIMVLFQGGTNLFMPQSGDRMRVTAALRSIDGLLALAPSFTNVNDVVWRLSSSNSLPTPAALDFATRTNVPVMEAAEARYLIATNVWISPAGGAYFPTVLTNVVMTNQLGQTFDLTIHPNLTNAGQLKPTGPVTILGVLAQNDPTAPYTTNYSLLPTAIVTGPQSVIQFTATNFAVLERAGSVTLAVTRTGSSSGEVIASFGTVNGTAVAGTDYVATNGVFTWADGETNAKSITVRLLDDAVEEADKAFTVGLSGTALGPKSTAWVTIVNDDFVVRPDYQVVRAGTNATVNVTPTANSLSYQWWKNGATVSGATAASFTQTNLAVGNNSTNWVVVTTTAGAVTSSVGVVIVAVPVTITSQPQSLTNSLGSPFSLCVGATGTAPLSYQWWRNGALVGGATSSCLSVANASTNDAGSYFVVVDNVATRPATSSVATLTLVGGTAVPTNGMGYYSVSNGCFVVTGSGEDIEGTEDRFFFVYIPLVGDGQVVAQLGGLQADNPQSEGGIMLRDGFNGGDRHVFLAKNARNDLMLRRRHLENVGSLENSVRGTNVSWLRLARTGDTFVGHASTNGLNWELVWWTTVPNLPATLQAGLAVTSHRHLAYATATFCNWSVGAQTPLPGTWSGAPRIWLAAEPVVAPPMAQLGGFKLLLGGTVGDVWALKASSSASAPSAAWVTLGNATNTYGTVPFLDRQALTNQSRYYRLQRVVP